MSRIEKGEGPPSETNAFVSEGGPSPFSMERPQVEY